MLALRLQQHGPLINEIALVGFDHLHRSRFCMSRTALPSLINRPGKGFYSLTYLLGPLLLLSQIPPDVSDRASARYYTFTQKILDLINLSPRPSHSGARIEAALFLRQPTSGHPPDATHPFAT